MMLNFDVMILNVDVMTLVTDVPLFCLFQVSISDEVNAMSANLCATILVSCTALVSSHPCCIMLAVTCRAAYVAVLRRTSCCVVLRDPLSLCDVRRSAAAL